MNQSIYQTGVTIGGPQFAQTLFEAASDDLADAVVKHKTIHVSEIRLYLSLFRDRGEEIERHARTLPNWMTSKDRFMWACLAKEHYRSRVSAFMQVILEQWRDLPTTTERKHFAFGITDTIPMLCNCDMFSTDVEIPTFLKERGYTLLDLLAQLAKVKPVGAVAELKRAAFGKPVALLPGLGG